MAEPAQEHPLKSFDHHSRKHSDYFEVYDKHFRAIRERKLNILEIGVQYGGSVEMWAKYFPYAHITGVDIDPMCKIHAGARVSIKIGDQSDRAFLSQFKNYDIIIDDGGHTMRQQIVTFEEMYDHVKDDGVYLCEDLHTSYWDEYGGGYKREGTFIEYSKNFIDSLNAWNSRDEQVLPVSKFTRATKSLHFYDSILVIEKGKRNKPTYYMTGTPTLTGV